MITSPRLPLLLGTLVITACSPEPDEAEALRYQTVEAVIAERLERFEIPREFAGLILPRQSTDLGFELGGQVVSLAVDEGDAVAAGQLIAHLDTGLLVAEREELEAQRSELEARLELNQLSLRRNEELQARGFAAVQALDELKAEQKVLQANLQRNAAAMSANRERLEESELRAPFAGAVSRRFVDEGAVVAGGAAVYRIIERGTLEARIGIPVRLHDAVQPGDRVPVLAADRETEGEVLSVGSDVTRATLTVPIRVAITEDIGAVPGDQAFVRVADAVDQPGYWLPATALTEGVRGLWNVYVLVADASGDTVLEARDVQVRYADASRVFVDGALADGERVVAGGLQRLVPGQRVRPRAPLPADGADTGP